MSQFQFIDQNGVKCWCDFGANLVQHFIGRYSRYQTVFLKLEEIISTFGRNLQKRFCYAEPFLLSLGDQLSLPHRASEVIFDSEVHFVSEVLPVGKVANLTSLVQSTNFTVLRTTSLLPKAKTSPIKTGRFEKSSRP